MLDNGVNVISCYTSEFYYYEQKDIDVLFDVPRSKLTNCKIIYYFVNIINREITQDDH